MKRFLLVLLIFTVQLSQQFYAQGCSQCKLVAKQGSELTEASFGSNINWGILYLLIIPYILLMFFFRKHIVALYKGLRKR